MVKVKLFSKAEKMRRLNEAQTIANISNEIQQVQTQIQQAEQDYMKRIEPLKKKLIELQAQMSTLQGNAAQQANIAKPGQVSGQIAPGQQAQGGIAASPGATTTTV